jgi:hypothetical protein
MAAVSFPYVPERQPAKKAQMLAQAVALWRHWKMAWTFVSEPLFQESYGSFGALSGVEGLGLAARGVHSGAG